MRILSVDDNYDIVKLLRLAVEHLGHEFHAEYNGTEGLRRIRNEKFDLVFLDLEMPGYSGLDVIDTLERDGVMARQAVILFTASFLDKRSVQEKALQKGVHSILTKPADLDAIIKSIRDVESELGKNSSP